MNQLFRNIPSVTELLERPALQQLIDKVNRNRVVTGVRDFLEKLRGDIQSATADMNIPQPSELAEHIAEWIRKSDQPRLRPVINATGILLHTGLGRAPLPSAAAAAMQQVAENYASVELDLESGGRSQRTMIVEQDLCLLTGAEAALVVNNNAAATILALAGVAKDKEVIVSRGQLVEIGGSYRLPDVMEMSGAILREIGTTNKTRQSDYESAVSDNTGAILRVHTSNYRVVGFTSEPTLAELIAVGKQHQLPVIDDIGSGALISLEPFGLAEEPVAGDSIRQGADLVLFSGDKLLGGPQCGIIVGTKTWIETLKQHPLMRAFRVDKLTLAALSATLRLYRDPETLAETLPLWGLLATSVENLQQRAERMLPQLEASPAVGSATIVEDVAYLGGGSVPTQQVPTRCVAITPQQGKVDQFAKRLRTGEPAILGRIHQDQLLLDLRSVAPKHDTTIVATNAAM